MPISKLIWNMSLPIIASMLVQALYNIVDSVFVSRVSEQALTAVSLAFPAQNLMIGLATGTAVGVNALMGRHWVPDSVNAPTRSPTTAYCWRWWASSSPPFWVPPAPTCSSVPRRRSRTSSAWATTTCGW